MKVQIKTMNRKHPEISDMIGFYFPNVADVRNKSSENNPTDTVDIGI